MILWRFLSEKMALLTIIFAVIAFLIPPVFLIFKDVFLWCFAATMFALGVVLHPEDARAALKKPKTIALGVMMQFWIMPMLGFAAASICVWQGVSPGIALGFIIVGCAPGAMASNVITF